MEEGLTFNQIPQGEKPPKKSRKRFFILIGVILLIGLAGFGANQFLGESTPVEEEIEITPTPTDSVFPTDTPVPTEEEEPTPENTKTPTPKPTSNPVDKTTGLDRSDISIAIQNGSGQAGVASKASDFFKGLGYKVISAGNADNFDYENVTISVKSDASKYLPLLKSDVAAQYTVGSTSATLSASSSADVVVIIGK